MGQAPIAAGNVATARERALNEAFRQLVEAAFAGAGGRERRGATSPALSSLRAGWLQRPKRLVRSYRVLEQSEDGGHAAGAGDRRAGRGLHAPRVRSRRGVANRGVAPGRAAGGGGGRARGGHGRWSARSATRASAPSCRPGARQRRGGAAGAGRARRAGRWRWSPVAPPARARCAAPASRRWSVSWACAWSPPTARRRRGAHRQRPRLPDPARPTPAPPASPGPPAICCRRCCPSWAAAAGDRGDLRVVTLDLDINEPAVHLPGAAGPAQDRRAPPRPRSAGWWSAGSRCGSALA